MQSTEDEHGNDDRERAVSRVCGGLDEELGTAESDALAAIELDGPSEAWPLHECAKEAEELARCHDVEELSEQLEQFHEMRLQLSTILKARTLPSKEPGRLESEAQRG